MKAFITGAAGFIGSHLVEELLRRNWQVVALLHERQIPAREGLRIIHGDIRDIDALRDMIAGTDVLFHLAAALGATQIKSGEFFQINAEGTANVLEAARETGIGRVIHLGSAGVLGSVRENIAVGEDHPAHPIDIYEKTKLAGELTAIQHAEEGMDVVIVRPGWAYGPGDRRTFKLIKTIAKKRFIMVTKGNTLLTPVYIRDLVEGVLLCVDRARSGEIYHLAGPEVLPVREVARIIGEEAGTPIPHLSLPLFPVKIAAWLLETAFSLVKKEAPLSMGKLGFFIHPKPLSIGKAKQELGYSPETHFRQGMRTTISWYREKEWLM